MKIYFVICTRDRTEPMTRCIGSILITLDKLNLTKEGEIVVFDDSTSQSIRQNNAKAISRFAKKISIQIVDSEAQSMVFKEVCKQLNFTATELHRFIRQFGQSDWDLARVRNFAFFILSKYLRNDEFALFVDDDICFTDMNYEGTIYNVKGEDFLVNLISNFKDSALAGRALAIGSDYVGRIDASIVEHLSAYFQSVSNLRPKEIDGSSKKADFSAVINFPNTLPVNNAVQGYSNTENIGPSISGGILAINRLAMASLHLPNFYNEDWIWLIILRGRGGFLKNLHIPLLHAAPIPGAITGRFLSYQSKGEVIYRALYSSINDLPINTDPIDWFKGTPLVDFLKSSRDVEVKKLNQCLQMVLDSPLWSASQNLYNPGLNRITAFLQSAIDYLNSARFIENTNEEILCYLEDVGAWKEIVACSIQFHYLLR